MKMQRIGRRNYMVTFALGAWDLNLHFITGRRYNYVIDTGLGSHSMAPVLAWLQRCPKPVVVVNTHFHWDHIWGNHCAADALIVSHRLCRDIIADKWDDMLAQNGQYVRGTVEKALPTLVFEQALYFPDDGIRLLYTPGHTIDCISVYDEADKVLNAGDNIGDTLDELLPSIETDKAVFAQTIHQYQRLDVAACISGHNVLLDAAVFGQILDLL